MKNIKLKLDTREISKLIEKINVLKQDIQRDALATISEVTGIGAEIAYEKSVVDTGETRDSTDIIQISNNHLQLVQRGDHVFENEFGLGVTGSQNKHPLAPSGWDYSSKRMRFQATNIASKKWYRPPNSKGKLPIQRTDGQIANMQMYQASLEMKKVLPKIMKLKVGESLSKV